MKRSFASHPHVTHEVEGKDSTLCFLVPIGTCPQKCRDDLTLRVIGAKSAHDMMKRRFARFYSPKIWIRSLRKQQLDTFNPTRVGEPRHDRGAVLILLSIRVSAIIEEKTADVWVERKKRTLTYFVRAVYVSISKQ